MKIFTMFVLQSQNSGSSKNSHEFLSSELMDKWRGLYKDWRSEKRSETTKEILQLKSCEINIFFRMIMMHGRREDIWFLDAFISVC